MDSLIIVMDYYIERGTTKMSNFHSPKREFPTSCLTNTRISKTVWSTTEMSKNCFDQHLSIAFLGFDGFDRFDEFDEFVRRIFLKKNSNRNGFVEFHLLNWVSQCTAIDSTDSTDSTNMISFVRRIFEQEKRRTDSPSSFDGRTKWTSFVVFSFLGDISWTVRRSAKRLKFSPPLGNPFNLRAGSLKWVTLLDDAPIT